MRNLWNLRSSKENMQTFERTEAQKKHLMNIFKARSVVDSQSIVRYIPQTSEQKQNRHSSIPRVKSEFQMKRLEKVNQLRLKVFQKPKYLQLGEKLTQICKMSRVTKQRQIDHQNNKMYTRLVNAPASINHKAQIRSNQEIYKYRINLTRRSRCTDYSMEAAKTMTKTKPKFKALRTLSSQQEFFRKK